MNAQEKDLKTRIDKLSNMEKLTVANYILESLDRPDPQVDEEWKKESKHRLKAMRAGKMKTAPFAKVIQKHLR